MTLRDGIKYHGLTKILYWELSYWPKALWLLTTQGGSTSMTAWTKLKLIAKRQCRLHWLRNC
jgi:hypothetical protein